MSNRIGQQFGNYRLVRLLGKGGFAEVYLGKHIHLDLQVAVKILHAHLMTREQEEFLEEARLVASLEHPSIVRVLDCAISADETPFLIMNYAPNGTLRERHPKGSRLPFPLINTYVEQLTSALHYAHERKLIHRDIKPENMLIGAHNEILLSDFGIALISASSSSQSTKGAAGTVAYMAPEQIMGKPRTASDQYALGVVVYEWLCGERPFRGSFAELTAQHLHAPPPSPREKNATISPELEEVVLKALSKEPQQRYPTIQDFAAALTLCIQQAEPPTEQRSPQEMHKAAFSGVSTFVLPIEEDPISQQHYSFTPPLATSNSTIELSQRVLESTGDLSTITAPTQSDDEKITTARSLKAKETFILPETLAAKKRSRPARRRFVILLSLLLVLALLSGSAFMMPQILKTALSAKGADPQSSTVTQNGNGSNTPGATGNKTQNPAPGQGPTSANGGVGNATATTNPSKQPTLTVTAASSPNPTTTAAPGSAQLQVDPTQKINTLDDCARDTSGGIEYISRCSFTLSNTSGSTENLSWSSSISGNTNSGQTVSLDPASGTIAPGQSQTVTFNGGGFQCPVSYSLVFKGPANTLTVPLVCTQVVVSPSGSNFSNNDCSKGLLKWTCTVTISASANNTVTTPWSLKTNSLVGNLLPGLTISQTSGNLAPGATTQVTFIVLISSCPGRVRFDFYVPGGSIDGPTNDLLFECAKEDPIHIRPSPVVHGNSV